jgi:glycosyltransferase involved in cell wall biosynthesis
MQLKYEEKYRSAPPRDAAPFHRDTVPASSRYTRKKICMLAHTVYESDNRVRRYAEALAKRGDHVDVIALTNKEGALGQETISGVSVYRIQRREHNERHRWTYAWRLLRFLVTSSIVLTRRHRKLNYDVIHVHNVPDFLVFAAWYPKWTGAKLILDIHDIVPELFASKFTTNDANWCVRILKHVEKRSAAFVDHVIVSNHLWYEKLIARSVSSEKCSVFLNHVDPDIFYRRVRTRNDGKVIMLFPGTFQWHQGLDVALKALAHIKDQVPNLEFHLYGGGGGGGAESRLNDLAGQLGLGNRVKFFRGVGLNQIADVIANADLGVVPKRADSFGNEAYSTKIMEFLSQGVPVVASRTKIDSFYFNEKVLRFFPSGDDRAMAEAMLDVIMNKCVRESLIASGYEYVKRNGWDSRRNDYLELVDSLAAERCSSVSMTGDGAL